MKDVFQKAAITIFKAFDDLIQTIIYFNETGVMYDSDTGTNTYVYEEHKLQIAFVDIRFDEIDNENILSTDRKAYVIANELPTTPKIRDYLLLENGEEWEIIFIKSDSAHAVHIFYLRRKTNV